MILKELLAGIDAIAVTGDPSASVTGISYDSRKVQKGHLFVAMKGERSDGHDYIQNAVAGGAVGILFDNCDGRIGTIRGGHPEIALIQVRESREALARAASTFYGEPSRSLTVAGITGTNGKTTTSYIMKSVLEAWGGKVGLIGTIQYMIGEEAYAAPHTTPEALEFQELLHRMLTSGCSHVVSEVSSHALAQKRVNSTLFKTGVFTNLTRDHLDFHHTMEDYFSAKKRLFTDLLDRHGSSVINIDDPYGRALHASLSVSHPETTIYSFGLEAGADLVATDIVNTFTGLDFRISMRGRNYRINSPLTGLPNVYNILAAVAASVSLGVPWEVILNGIKKAGNITGRFEKVEAGQKFLAVVDFAHTEDALERLIYTARGLSKGKIITVFGCGGDRDKGKRPAMGAVATRLSDFVIITSDNPRSESPEGIIGEIAAGAVRKNYLIEPDRQEAVKRAILMAAENDVVLVAGKGHENYQEVGGRKYPFNDREVLQAAIEQLISSN